MQVPSGKIFNALDLRVMKKFAEIGVVQWSDKPFVLKSGRETRIYIVLGREDLTENLEAEWLVGEKIARVVKRAHIEKRNERRVCLIGIPTAGTVLANAAALVNFRERIFLDKRGAPLIVHRLMREATKKYGAHHNWVNGRPNLTRDIYWTVDNIATDGGSKIEWAVRLEEDGYPAKKMPCLIFIDRQQGAVKRLADEGFEEVVVAYNLLDITYVLGELGIWPKDLVRKFEEEIAAHQLVQ